MKDDIEFTKRRITWPDGARPKLAVSRFILLLTNARKTGAVSGAPPKWSATSFTIRRPASAPFAVLACLLVSCTDPSAKLPNYGNVPHFTMTDSQGQIFDSASLTGKVWLVDFIYTSCPGPCPRMTSQMHELQKQLANDADVRLVSISVDPEHDTPPVLNEFAHHFGGPADDWFFLTGPPATVHLLAHDVFKVGDVIQNMDHSTKFMVVDKQGNLRGYYSSDDDADAGIPALLRDVKSLRHQRT